MGGLTSHRRPVGCRALVRYSVFLSAPRTEGSCQGTLHWLVASLGFSGVQERSSCMEGAASQPDSLACCHGTCPEARLVALAMSSGHWLLVLVCPLSESAPRVCAL